MAYALGFSSSRSEQQTTDNSVTAQDSEVIQGQKSGGHAVSASDNSTVNITDGGAFTVVENVVKGITSMLGDWTTKQNQFALSGTTSLLENSQLLGIS